MFYFLKKYIISPLRKLCKVVELCIWSRLEEIVSLIHKYLGYSFYNYRGKCRFRVHPKSVIKMKNKIRELTNRSNGWGNEYRALKLTQFVRGWVNYFGMADMKALLTKIDDLFDFPSYSIGNILPLVPLNVIVLYIISEQILKPS